MLAAVAFVCAAGFMGYTAYDRATMTDEKKFMLANLEALTETEITIPAICLATDDDCYINEDGSILNGEKIR